jgi:Na+/H+ antiporter NhaD/arsenite permease-like protein
MGMLLGLGVMWILTELIHSGKDEIEKGTKSVNHALRKIDTPSILFFFGILIAISALESVGVLRSMATWLDETIGNVTIVGVLIGFLSAVVDNVPLVAAAQGMYTLEIYPAISFTWYLRKFTLLASIGYLAGVAVYVLQHQIFG